MVLCRFTLTRKRNRKYQNYTHKRRTNLGQHRTKAKALRQQNHIHQWYKNKYPNTRNSHKIVDCR